MIPLRPEFAPDDRFPENWSHASFSDRAAARDRALPDPGVIDAYYPLLPVDTLAALRREIDADLQPAGPQGAATVVAVLSNWLLESVLISNPAEFTRGMIDELQHYPIAVLEAAARQARRTERHFPSIARMVELCEEQMARPRNERRAVDAMEAEHRWRERRAQIRLEETIERQRRDSEALTRTEEQAQLAAGRLRDLQSRLARGGDTPSLADVELVTTKMRPILWRGAAAYLTWSEYADQDPRAAAELLQRLALIRHTVDTVDEPAEYAAAIADALADAGFKPPDPAPLRRHRQRPMEASPPPLSKCKAALASLQTWRFRDADDPAVQQMLRRMGE